MHHARWTRYLSYVEDWKHLCAATKAYPYSSALENTMLHLRHLTAPYNKASKAKWAYHPLPTSQPQAITAEPHATGYRHTTGRRTICISQRDKQRPSSTLWRCLHCASRGAPNTTYYKHRSARANVTHGDCSGGKKAGHTANFLKPILVGHGSPDTKKLGLYHLFYHMRPGDKWDPTLWEIPLQPLPKRHKAHQDPDDWQIHLP